MAGSNTHTISHVRWLILGFVSLVVIILLLLMPTRLLMPPTTQPQQLSSTTKPSQTPKIEDLGTITLRQKAPIPSRDAEIDTKGQYYTPIQPRQRPPQPQIDPNKFFYPIPFQIDLDRAEAEYGKFFEQALQMKDGEQELLFLSQLKRERLQEGHKRTFDSQITRLAGMRYLRHQGLQRYQWMGLRQLQSFEKSLQNYLQQKGSPLNIPPESSPIASLATKMVEVAGYYPLLLQQIGVKADSQSLEREQRFWLRVLFLARWGLQASGSYPLPAMLGETVYRDYLKARILWTPSIQKRLWAVRELNQLEQNFPLHRVLGWVFIQANQIDAAKASLRDALRQDPQDTLSRSLLDKLPASSP
jgi:hypothetical protein